ncbi:TetR family transcriptional regulator [Epidermidibacterium keratini]|uniref:TetR family transcriptional regulator n=1 Tax=Epidermidibacterium keratini TaxID=1891644 RepID=A0A7L4YIK6_9ACTN|nr:TetR family transcriptional regulator [Epidermidibacterium keratini]QHB99234.1 TetR family transcriptional regulator [Epidermidibacterium keratini]
MARNKTPKSAWVDAGLTVLAEQGVDAVRIEALSRSLAVTKGGFYGYFGGRDELLAAMLTTWERTVTDDVVAAVEADALDADPRDRLRHLLVAIRDRDTPAMRIDTEIAIRDWARREPNVARIVERVDTIRSSYLRDIFAGFCSEEEAEVRTAIAMSVRLASQTMTLGTKARSPEDMLQLITGRLFS